MARGRLGGGAGGQKRGGAPEDPDASSLVLLSSRGRKSVWAPLVESGLEADKLVIRCRADALRRSTGMGEDLLSRGVAALCGGRTGSVFVAVSVELRWGALVELGRSEGRMEDHHTLWWEEMELELPDGLPERVYLRFAVYESLGRYAHVDGTRLSGRDGGGVASTGGYSQPRPKLIGMAGATVDELRANDARGRGAPLTIHAPPVGKGARPVPRGTLWIERCDMVGFVKETPPPKPAEAPDVAPATEQRSRRIPRSTIAAAAASS